MGRQVIHYNFQLTTEIIYLGLCKFGEMVLKDYMPQKGLEEFVRCFRIVHFDFSDSPLPPPKPYTPRPEVCLAFYPCDKETVHFYGGKIISNISVALVGQQTMVSQRYVGRNFKVLQIIFQPGALHRLTGLPLDSIRDQYLDANELSFKNVDEVNEKLYHAKSYVEMVNILQDYVVQLVRNAKKESLPIDKVCSYLQANNGQVSLDILAKKSCYSVRQFERNFKERTGVNAKTFQRILRFDHAFRLKNSSQDLSWRAIAFQSGFYDYQHLVKDYHTFTGCLPEQFHSLETPEGKLGGLEGFYENEKYRN